MGTALLRILIAIVVSATMYVVPGYLMMRLTRPDQLKTKSPRPVPLNLRIEGYDQTSAKAYWDWLGPEGRLSEQRFLEADLAFPFAYGGGLLAGLLILWLGLGRPFHPVGLLAPVAITILADWIENLVQWHQLRRFLAGETLQPNLIQIASLATSIKILFFSLSVILFLALCGWLLWKVFTPSRAGPADHLML